MNPHQGRNSWCVNLEFDGRDYYYFDIIANHVAFKLGCLIDEATNDSRNTKVANKLFL